jgi:hypothetical protein
VSSLNSRGLHFVSCEWRSHIHYHHYHLRVLSLLVSTSPSCTQIDTRDSERITFQTYPLDQSEVLMLTVSWSNPGVFASRSALHHEHGPFRQAPRRGFEFHAASTDLHPGNTHAAPCLVQGSEACPERQAVACHRRDRPESNLFLKGYTPVTMQRWCGGVCTVYQDSFALPCLAKSERDNDISDQPSESDLIQSKDNGRVSPSTDLPWSWPSERNGSNIGTHSSIQLQIASETLKCG